MKISKRKESKLETFYQRVLDFKHLLILTILILLQNFLISVNLLSQINFAREAGFKQKHSQATNSVISKIWILKTQKRTKTTIRK